MNNTQIAEKNKNVNRTYFIDALIVVLIMTLFRFIPPFGAMTPLGMEILGIFLGALWGWIRCDMIWPSVLAFFFLGFSTYGKTVGNSINLAFSNGIVQLILWLLIFSAILTVSGIGTQLSNRLMASKMIKGRPWLLSVMICAATYVCSAFGAGFAGVFISWEFVSTISKQVGYSKDDKWPKMMIVAVAFANSVGGVVLPFMVGVVATFGYLASASKNLFGAYNYMQYLIFSIIFGFAVMAIYFVFCKLILRPDMSKLKTAEVEVKDIAPFSTKQKIAIGALAALLVLTVIPSVLPAAQQQFMNRIGTSAFVLAICAFITLFRDKEGKQYFTFKELADKGLFWNIMFMVATAIVVSTALSAGETGFSKTFVNIFSLVFAGKGPYFFALVVSIATLILTNFINNAVAGAIMVPLMYSFAKAVGANPTMITALIIFTSNVGLLLPCASPVGALIAGKKDWLSTKDVVKQTLICILAMAIGVALIGIPLGNMVF